MHIGRRKGNASRNPSSNGHQNHSAKGRADDSSSPTGSQRRDLENGLDPWEMGRRDPEPIDADTSLLKRLRKRVRHFTWAWFTMVMATGGIANVLFHVPLRFKGLYEIGVFFLILNLILFVFCIVMISLRFFLYPQTFIGSFLHPTESLFIPALAISLGTVLITITEYGLTPGKAGYWLVETMVALYWVYTVLAVVFSAGVFLTIWSTQTFTISSMTPSWIFPAYPLLIVGPFASNIARHADQETALRMIISGWIFQGTGFMMSIMVYSAFLHRLMTQKLPRESVRPAMFISVGPSGFTVAAIVGLGKLLPDNVYPEFMGNGEMVGQVGKIGSYWAGLWLWGLACWLFLVSVAAHFSSASRGSLDFSMTWYSFVFPNTGLLTATFAIAGAVDSPAIEWVGSILTIILIIVWLFVFVMMIRAVWNRQILWPQKQEDRDEGGWKDDEREKAYLDYKKAKADVQRQSESRNRERGGSILKKAFGGSRDGEPQYQQQHQHQQQQKQNQQKQNQQKQNQQKQNQQKQNQQGQQDVEGPYQERDNDGLLQESGSDGGGENGRDDRLLGHDLHQNETEAYSSNGKGALNHS